MTLVQLEYIVALHQLKHFAKAAAHCHVTQPSLSMQVQKLEEELGEKIFLRTTPVTTTASGLIIIEQAKKILAEAAMLPQLVQHEKNIISGTLHLGIIPTLAPYILPYFLQSFIRQYPQVRMSIHEYTTEQIIRQLKNGALDAGLLATPLHVPELSEQPLFNEEFVAYVSKEEKLFTKKYILPDDINIHNLWLLQEGHCLRGQVMNLCALQKDASIEKHFDYTSGSIETLRRFVDKNGGITLLPELATLDLTSAQRGKLRYFKSPAPAREISLVTLKTFSKQRLLHILYQSILSNLPAEILKKRKLEIMEV